MDVLRRRFAKRVTLNVLTLYCTTINFVKAESKSKVKITNLFLPLRKKSKFPKSRDAFF